MMSEALFTLAPYVFIATAVIGLLMAIPTLSEAHRAAVMFGPTRLTNGRGIVANGLRRRALISVAAYIVFIVVGSIGATTPAPEPTLRAITIRIGLLLLVALVVTGDLLDRWDRWHIRGDTHMHTYSHTHTDERRDI